MARAKAAQGGCRGCLILPANASAVGGLIVGGFGEVLRRGGLKEKLLFVYHCTWPTTTLLHVRWAPCFNTFFCKCAKFQT